MNCLGTSFMLSSSDGKLNQLIYCNNKAELMGWMEALSRAIGNANNALFNVLSLLSDIVVVAVVVAAIVFCFFRFFVCTFCSN